MRRYLRPSITPAEAAAHPAILKAEELEYRQLSLLPAAPAATVNWQSEIQQIEDPELSSLAFVSRTCCLKEACLASLRAT
jgi:hypothetical protein